MKAHCKALFDKAERNIEACSELIRTGHFDIAASRAYYAMFYIAEAVLAEEGEEFSSHGEVHGAFGRLFAKTGRLDAKFHRFLIDAYRERQAADYDAPAEVEEEEARSLLDQAADFLLAAREHVEGEE